MCGTLAGVCQQQFTAWIVLLSFLSELFVNDLVQNNHINNYQ